MLSIGFPGKAARTDDSPDLSGLPTGKSASQLRAEANTALQDQDPGAAEAAYLALLSMDLRDIYGLVGLGLVARLRGGRDVALDRFREAAAAWPSHTWPLLEISAELGAANQPEQAEAVLRNALRLAPHDYYVLMALGRSLRARAEVQSGLEFFKHATVHHATQASAYSELAAALVQLGRLTEALAACEQGLKAGASKSVLLRAKAQLLRLDRQNEAALAAWRAALEESPDDSALKLEIATETAAVGKPVAALAAYQAVIKDETISTSKRRDAALAAATLAQSQKITPLAIGHLEQALAFDADNVKILCELGSQYRVAQRFRDFEEAYLKALRQSPTSFCALGGLAIVRRHLGRIKEAVELLETASSIDPKNDWIRYELAISFRDTGRIEAAAALESITSSSSMYPLAQTTLGHMARDRGAHSLAAERFELAARTAADPTDAWCLLANEMRALGDFVAAREVIARIFACDPEFYRGHMAEGYLKRALNDRDGARAAFIHAAAITPSEPQPWVELSNEERELGNRAASVAAIEAALERDPRHEGALLKKGAYLTETGERAAALSIYESLREARPASIWAYLAEAQLLADQGAFASALETLATAREKCAINSQLELREAAIFRQQGLLDSAFERLSCAYERFPQELWPWFYRVSAAIDLGLYDIAEMMLAAPPPVTEREIARVENMRAQLAKARWNLEAAIDNFGLAVSLDPEDLQAVYERAKLKLITFDLGGARQDLLSHAKLSVAAASREGRAANPSQTHVGQLYDEFVVDRDLASQFDALRRLAPQEQVSPLCETVRHFPDSTGAAIGLMIALRRSGRFDRPLTTLGGQPRIPRVITQFWNDPEPPADILALMISWTRSDPAFKIDVFDDPRAREFLRGHCNPDVARAFNWAREPAQRADIFRLARLFTVGGYFIDADDRAREGLEAHVPPNVEFFAHQEDLGSIGNNVMGAVPGHPAIEAALHEAVAAVLRGDQDIIWLSTGPGLLTRSLARWFAEKPEATDERLSQVAILTLGEMRRAAAMHCHAAYKTTNRAWLNVAFKKRNGR